MTRGYAIAAVALIALVLVGSAAVYPRLPDRIPVHWDIHGKVDGYGAKTWGVFVMPVIMAGLLALFAALPWLSPPTFKLEASGPIYGFIVMVVLGMMTLIHAAMMFAAMGQRVDVVRVITVGVCLGFALMGNVMGKVRRNFFVGVRVPWTLASERVWNETHRVAAWLFFGCGLLGAAVALVGHPLAALALLAPALLIPVLFSLVRSKQLERRGEL